MKNKLEKNLNILISFKSINEISEECLSYVDILDLKNPDKGAIGSWEIKNLKEVVSKFSSKIKISATLGDEKEVYKILEKLELFDLLKLDYIKFGVFVENENGLNRLLKSVSDLRCKTELVPVVFVENSFIRKYLISDISIFKKYGFNFLLLDTYLKELGNLSDFCSRNYLTNLINNSLDLKLNIGLAGKLNISNIPQLVNLKPKIMGFRSAVCEHEKRNLKISITKLKKLHYSIISYKRQAMDTAGAW